MSLEPSLWFAVALVVLAAYTVFGISGFGSALVSIPLLAHLLPLKTVVPLMLLLDFSAALLNGLRFRGLVNRAEVLPVVPGIVLGAGVGVWLLARSPGDLLLLPLGVFVAAFAGYNLLGRRGAVRLHRRWGYAVGLGGGVLGALFGVGGPLYAIYFAGRLAEPLSLRATLSAVFSLSTGLRIVLFLAVGLLLEAELWVAATALLPLVIFGTRLGQGLAKRLPGPMLLRVLNALLIVSGASLVVRGLHAVA